MKKLLLITLLALSAQTFATGGFTCDGTLVSSNEPVTIYGVTGHIEGNPLVADIRISYPFPLGNFEEVISMNQVIKYISLDEHMLLVTFDRETKSSMRLSVVSGKGKAVFSGGLFATGGWSEDMTCIFE